MLTGNKTLKNHPDVIELKKLTTGVEFVRRNSSKSITNIYAFGSGKRLICLDKVRMFATIAEVNHYAILIGNYSHHFYALSHRIIFAFAQH
jgi:hypothetical protein